MTEPVPSSVPNMYGRWFRRARRVAIIPAMIYVLLVVALFFLQERLIFPGSAWKGRREAEIPRSDSVKVIELETDSGQKVTALFAPALSNLGAPLADASSRPTLLYFYGNGECLGMSGDKAGAIRRRGLNVFMVDYVGYGLSEGHPSEAGCIATADASYAHLVKRSDVDPSKILIGGFSLGGAVAIDLASRKPSIGLIVSCTFTSLGEMAWRQYPFMPISLLLRHRFASEAKIGKVSVPTLIAIGDEDGVIPQTMADRLATAAGGPVTRIVMKGAGHDDLVSIAEMDAEVSSTLERFLDGIR